MLHIVELLVTSDSDRLNEELVFAARIGGRLLLHRLQEDRDLDFMAGLDTTRVWSDAVLLRGCRFNLFVDVSFLASGGM